MVGMQIPAAAQVLGKTDAAPAGTVVYSLPSTTLVLRVTALHESYKAGPYAQYAQKYLGLDVKQTSGDFYKIKSIEMAPYIEADPNVSAAVNLQGSKIGTANFINPGICTDLANDLEKYILDNCFTNFEELKGAIQNG